jgi:hypothetical protein
VFLVYQVTNTLYSFQKAPAFTVLVQYLIVLFTERPLVTVLARAPQHLQFIGPHSIWENQLESFDTGYLIVSYSIGFNTARLAAHFLS